MIGLYEEQLCLRNISFKYYANKPTTNVSNVRTRIVEMTAKVFHHLDTWHLFFSSGSSSEALQAWWWAADQIHMMSESCVWEPLVWRTHWFRVSLNVIQHWWWLKLPNEVQRGSCRSESNGIGEGWWREKNTGSMCLVQSQSKDSSNNISNTLSACFAEDK